MILVGASLRPLASRPLEQLVLHLAGALVLALAVWTPGARSALRAIRVPVGAMLLLSTLAWLQSIPLPEWLVAWLSPEHARLTRDAFEVLEDAESPRFYLSLAPEASRLAALSWATAAAFFFAAHCAGAKRRIAVAILLGGLLQLVIGFPPWNDFSHLRLKGSLGSPGNLAFYLEICLALVFAAGWWAYRTSQRDYDTVWMRTARIGIPATLWLVLFAGLLITGSRAGLAAALLAVSLQGVMLFPGVRGRALAGAGIGLAVAGSLLVAVFGGREILFRLLASPLFEAATFSGRPDAYEVVFEHGRLDVWSLALDVGSRFPWLGTGQGTFYSAFQLVHPEWMRSGVTIYHAHNDPIELLVTGGGVALTIAALGVASVLSMLWKRFSSRTALEARALALGGIGAIAGTGLLDLTVFGLLLPSNATTLAILLGSASATYAGASFAGGGPGRARSRPGGAPFRTPANGH